jgi:hypothetical protein
VPAIVRGLVERRLPQLIMASSAGDHRMPRCPIDKFESMLAAAIGLFFFVEYSND